SGAATPADRSRSSQRQTASTQDWLAPQSVSSPHTGAGSPGVTQNPPWQTVAPPQLQQSALDAQPERQVPSTHIWPFAQSTLVLQLGCGRSSAVQSPLSQRSFGPHWASVWHGGWQAPLMQVPPSQAALSTHCPPPAGFGWQKP